MNKYAQLRGDQLEEHLSNYLLDSWSYSKVACFARNQADFERTYLYMEKTPRSIASVAGNAYHEALKLFFGAFNIDVADLTDLTVTVQSYLDGIADDEWKLTDKFPTAGDARAEARRIAMFLVENFYKEMDTYVANIAQVISVEDKKDAWVTVNGVDIPLPLHFITDLVVRTKDGKTVIVDHKSKSTYTDEKSLKYSYGQQGITYVLGIEACTDLHIDEIWLVENKTSKNRDGSPQVRLNVIPMDAESRKYHERFLYRDLAPMLKAVSDPDFVYTINSNDNFCDMAELYDFITRVEIETATGNAPESRREMIERRKRLIAASGEEWRDIPGYEGLYKVSNKGRVLSCKRTIRISRTITREQNEQLVALGTLNGMQSVNLFKNGHRRSVRVHRLVAEAFIPNDEGKKYVAHINGIDSDNRPENLQWVSNHLGK